MSTSITDKLSPAEIQEITTHNTYGTWRRQKGWTRCRWWMRKAATLSDAEGKKYLDFSAQLMCVTFGHKNRAVIEAIQEQAESWPTSGRVMRPKSEPN